MVIIPVSFKLWKSRGKISFHSIDEGMCWLEIIGRWDANASQIIKININSAKNESNDPMDDTIFHFVKASG